MSPFTSTARSRELGAALRRIREAAGINGQAMALKLHWSAALLSRAETGKRPFTAMEVTQYLAICGVTGKVWRELVALAEESDDYRIRPHPDQIPDELLTLIFHEKEATAIDVFAPVFIPGMLQTPEYARAVFREVGRFDEPGIDFRVEIRMERKQVLTRFEPAICSLFVHENALRSGIGGPQVMAEQMLHMLFAGGRPQCSIRVVPASAAGRGLANGPFHIFRYKENPPVTYIEHEITSDFLENDHVVWSYQNVLKRIATVALGEAESRSMIAELASEYEQQGVTPDDNNAAEPQRVAQE